MTNDRQITITVGASRNSIDWRPQTLLISELWERLRVPQRSTETMAEYLAMTKGQQDQLKDVGGYVAGASGGRGCIWYRFRSYLGAYPPSTDSA